MTDDKTKRKKLTLSSSASPKSLDNLSLAREKNKKSVLIEKKVPRRRNQPGSFFNNKKTITKNKPSFQKEDNTEEVQKRPAFLKSFEIRRLAEQKATKRINPANKTKDSDKSKLFDKKREYKLTLSRALNEEEPGAKERSLASIRRARLKEKKDQNQNNLSDSLGKVIREVNIPQVITIQELSNRMAEQASNIIKHLLGMGVKSTINHQIDADTAEYLVKEFGHKPIREKKPDLIIKKADKIKSNLFKKRPPIVTVMGHVDHGKTSILDAMRGADIVSQEHGGITQHIGAYQVQLKDNELITFIDTPGHAAFTEMRARGSKVTDIVVLVVAADDGIKPQTIEAINHSKAAKVPIVVAINKCDLPGADPTKIRNQLLEHELIAEELNGDILTAEVSAKTKKNLDKLKEQIFLQAEILELKADFEDKATGIVIESKVDKGRGAVSTVLITNGKLKKGDFFVSGGVWGKVRAMINFKGQNIETATPSTPVEILGINGNALSGDDFVVVESESKAKEINKYRLENSQTSNKLNPISVESAFDDSTKTKELPIIIKADVHGSSEALKTMINKIKHDEVKPKIILSDTGLISETDVSLAKASNAMLIAFNIKPSKEAKNLAENYKMKINYFNVIYEVLDFINSALSGLLKPIEEEEIIGSAEVLEIFKVSKIGKVAGSKVLDGEIITNTGARLIRDGSVLYTGFIKSIFREKNAAKQVAAGLECGITLKDFADFKKKDVIEVYKVTKTERSL